MPDTNISGQGYLYGSDPKATNPFYGKEESGGGGAAPDKYVKSATIVQGENSNVVKLRTVTVESGTSRTTDSTEWNITGEKGERGEQGQPGTPGAKGEQGEPGKDGVTPDITATATVSQTTGTASVTVTKTGTKEAPKFNFAFSGIKGEKGEGGSGGTGSGEKGDKGDPGEPGKAATISVGTTTTGAPGSNAAVTNTGTENAAVLNFTIPRGEKGDTGATGATGEAGAPGAKGEPGTPGAKGDPGEPGKAATISVGTTTTGAPGSNAAVTNTGTENAAVLNFTIPKGEKGDKGDTGADGAPGAKGDPGDPVSKAGLMTDVSMTNENGVYTFKQTKYDETGTATAETEIGTVEVPTASAGIVEVKDSVVENNTKGYDFHTITETENDGTENEVGKFYIAQKQVIFGNNLNSGSYTVVDQAGNESTIYRYKLQNYISGRAVNHTFNAEAKFLRFSFDVTYGSSIHITSVIFPNVDPSTLKDNDVLLAAPFMCTGNYAPAVESLIFPFVMVYISKGRFVGDLWPHLGAGNYSLTFNSFTVEDIL